MNRLAADCVAKKRSGSLAVSLACLGTLIGCAAPAPVAIRDPVGPEIEQLDPAPHQGDLLVFSADRVSTTTQSEYPVHTAYTIYTLEGRVLKRVRNLAGTFNQDPERVSLPEGSYRVRALKEGGGEVIVTVIIRPGKTTVVDLDGTALPQDGPARGNWVRLPDGHVVGWQAGCVTSSCP